MDQTTPQNAALVEEMAAAASSLIHQAHGLVETVAQSKLPEALQRVVPRLSAIGHARSWRVN